MPKLVESVYKRAGLVGFLRAVNSAAVFLTVMSLGAFVLPYASQGDWYGVFACALSLGIPFVLVSLLRRLLSLPRPFEVWGLDVPIKHRGGSFPSRHAFSAFAIGAYILPFNAAVGCTVLALGIVISTVRVLLGLHFLRDVIAGAIIGVLSAVIGVLIF